MEYSSSMPRPRVSGKSNDEIAAIAYGSVEGLEFLEMNDGNRLGFHIYRYITGELPSIAEAIYESKSRISLSAGELETTIMKRLNDAGVATA